MFVFSFIIFFAQDLRYVLLESMPDVNGNVAKTNLNSTLLLMR